jgi:hypothetical protein
MIRLDLTRLAPGSIRFNTYARGTCGPNGNWGRLGWPGNRVPVECDSQLWPRNTGLIGQCRMNDMGDFLELGMGQTPALAPAPTPAPPSPPQLPWASSVLPIALVGGALGYIQSTRREKGEPPKSAAKSVGIGVGIGAALGGALWAATNWAAGQPPVSGRTAQQGG